ncbi:SUKH-4 family immunity protein [Actinomadura citrea]|uniref:SUKH-4 family immunity protein n=1 Tax=Actinomadura citrea TaxID=46158 RepID=UPI003CE5577F
MYDGSHTGGHTGGQAQAGPTPGHLPAVGAGNTLTLNYRDAQGEEVYLSKISGPGLPSPFWQAWEELQRLGIPAENVTAAFSEIEPCRLPGCYCDPLLRDFAFPHAEISFGRPYGATARERAAAVAANSEQAAALARMMGQSAPPGASPVPPPAGAPPAPPLDPAQLAQVLASAFGPAQVRRYQAGDLRRIGVPPAQAAVLEVAGLPAQLPHIFQAWTARPMPEQLGIRRSPLSEDRLHEFASLVSIGGDGHCMIGLLISGPPHVLGGVWAVDPVLGTTRFVNSGPGELARSLALLSHGRRRMRGRDAHGAGEIVERIQAQLASVDPAAFHGEDRWWSLVVEQMWNGLL